MKTNYKAMHSHTISATVACTLLACIAGPLRAQIPAQIDFNLPLIRLGDGVITGVKQSTELDTTAAARLRFEDVPVRDVVSVVMGDILALPYQLHGTLEGKVTIVSPGVLSKDDALFYLEAALQPLGLLLVRDSRGVFHVGRADALKGISASVRLAQPGKGLPPGFGVVLLPLKHVSAVEMARILKPLVPTEALLKVDPSRNLILLAGTRAQAEGWVSLVESFDVDIFKGMSFGLFPLKNLGLKEIQSALAAMVAASASAPPIAAASQPQAGSLTGQTTAAPQQVNDAGLFIGGLQVIPIERLNSILVVSPNPDLIKKAAEWVAKLDAVASDALGPKVFVHTVKNGSATHLANLLMAIYGTADTTGDSKKSPQSSGVAPALASTTASTSSIGSANVGQVPGGSSISNQPSAAANQGGVNSFQLSSRVRVVADERNNTLLISATPTEYGKLQASLRSLDVPPTQVLIEASIVEITLNDELNFGLQWSASNSTSSGGTGTSVLSTAGGSALGAALAGFSYTLKRSTGDIRAVLNALADKSLVQVISNPSLVVMSNSSASIMVGTQQPIRSSETSSSVSADAPIRTTIQYKDTGVNLSVVPTVLAEDMINMQIQQAVTDVGAIDTATGQRAFLQRQISSKVAIRSGETLVMGGLIRDNNTSGSAGIPGLHEVPIIGALFGQKSKSSVRTELLVVITPRVLKDDVDVRQAGSEIRRSMTQLREKIKGVDTQSEPPSEAKQY